MLVFVAAESGLFVVSDAVSEPAMEMVSTMAEHLLPDSVAELSRRVGSVTDTAKLVYYVDELGASLGMTAADG